MKSGAAILGSVLLFLVGLTMSFNQGGQLYGLVFLAVFMVALTGFCMTAIHRAKYFPPLQDPNATMRTIHVRLIRTQFKDLPVNIPVDMTREEGYAFARQLIHQLTNAERDKKLDGGAYKWDIVTPVE